MSRFRSKSYRNGSNINSLDHLQHQAKQYSNESHTIPHRTRSYRNGSNITLWTTYSTKPSSTVTKSYNTAPNEIIQERLKHYSLDHLQHQAKQYSNEIIQMSGFRTKSYKCPGSERNHTNVRVWNFPPCPIVVAASGICVGAAGVALKWFTDLFLIVVLF